MPEFAMAPDLEQAFRPFQAFPLKTGRSMEFASPGNANRAGEVSIEPTGADVDHKTTLKFRKASFRKASHESIL
ncbi:hypothetical protein E2562_001039 [Oryza meyeriana var. granulata]|uniref:Uncharacterized protein n=1 Tax=Oryza meyeriana var. granulata TaxID=110450 RepID=A0A6G1ECV8_9ORYZ|nr:hypothetical protein E2562_001039 [Oryza meyeriana var. granulata]